MEARRCQWFAAPGVGVVAAAKSVLLWSLSLPLGRRSMEWPGEAAVVGATAAALSTKALPVVIVPQATASTMAPPALRMATAPEAAMPFETSVPSLVAV